MTSWHIRNNGTKLDIIIQLTKYLGLHNLYTTIISRNKRCDGIPNESRHTYVLIGYQPTPLLACQEQVNEFSHVVNRDAPAAIDVSADGAYSAFALCQQVVD